MPRTVARKNAGPATGVDPGSLGNSKSDPAQFFDLDSDRPQRNVQTLHYATPHGSNYHAEKQDEESRSRLFGA